MELVLPAMLERARTSELRSLLRLAVPLSFAHVGQMAMGFVDVAVVGRLGAVPLAAVGLGNGIFFTLCVVGLGVMLGLDPLVAQAIGAREEVRARQLLWQGMWLALAVGAVLSFPIAGLTFLLEPFGVGHEVARETAAYTLTRMPSLVPLLAYAGIRSYLQAHHHTLPVVVAVVVANVANFALDYLFVFGGEALPFGGGALAWIPSLGAAGAALATVACTFLQLAIVAWGVRAVPLQKVSSSVRRINRSEIRLALRVGGPVGLQMGAEVGVFALAGFLAARIGADAAAAHQIALTLASATFCAAVGVASAGAVRVAHAIGAEDASRTRGAGMLAFALGGSFMAVCAIGFLLWPQSLASLLTDEPEILREAVPLLAVAAAFQISDGLQAVGAGVLRGAGDTRFAFLANLAGHYLVGLPIALVAGFVLGQGVVGLWYGLAAGLTAVALTLLVRFVRMSARPIPRIESRPAAASAKQTAA
jgi:multidrug resistance protein, MATE family